MAIGGVHTQRKLGCALVLIGAMLLGARARTGAQETPAPATPAIVGIPIPEVAVQAEAVATELRSIDLRLTEELATQAIAQQLPDTVDRVQELAVATSLILRGRPVPGALDQISGEWTALQTSLTVWKETLTGNAVALEGDIDRLAAQRAVWVLSGQLAKDEGAPPTILARTQATLENLQATRQRADQRRAEILALQDQVTRAAARCDQELDQLAQFRRVAVRGLLTPDGPPIWSTNNPIFACGTTPPRIGDAFGDAGRALVLYLGAHVRQAVFHLALWVVLWALLWRARPLLPRWIEAEPALARVAVAMELPVSAAIVLAAAATPWIFPHPPIVFRQLVATIALVPFIRILRRLIDPVLFPALYALAVFFLVNRLRDLMLGDAALTQGIMLLEIPVAAAVVGVLLRGSLRAAAGSGVAVTVARRLGRSLLLVLAAAFVSVALGYQSLARFVAGGSLTSLNIALFLWATARVAEGLVALVLRVQPAALLRSVTLHRSLIERRCTTLIRWTFALLWAYLTLIVLQMRAWSTPCCGTR